MSCLLRHITASKNFRKNESNDIWKPEPSHDRKEFRWETSKRMNTDRAVEPAIRSAGTAIFLWSSSLAIANFFFRQIIYATFFFLLSSQESSKQSVLLVISHTTRAAG